ncbi:ribonuclease H-like domain-containing protein, partial [Tanacetum coccineum]
MKAPSDSKSRALSIEMDSKLVIAFDELKCYILNQDLKAGKVLGTGRQFGGLYYFDGSQDQVLNVLRPNLLFENDKSDVMCETFQRAKQPREPFPLSDHVSTELGKLVHLDLWGPYKGGLPLNMWTECILTATYLINRLPSSVLNEKSPFELIYKRIPSLKHLRSFGCVTYATILNNSDKFGSRSEKCVLIGYSNYKKGYKLFSLDQKQIVFSRDVKFFEDIFPFKQKLDMSNEQSVPGLNNEDFFNLDGFIDHYEIPYDDERSDPSPSRYGTPSSQSGSTSDTHNEKEGGHSLGSDAAASENDRSANPNDNDNNTSEGNGPLILSQIDQNISE